MRYGTPYKGSKNAIAEWVYSHFPKLDNFYDLFAGGCAITQKALMAQEYKHYYCNDIDADGITLFLNAIYGKYNKENRWISRDDFFNLKDNDPYVKYAWSFGNNGRDYLYSKEIEPYKRAWHFAIYFNDFSPAEELGLDLKCIDPIKEIYARYLIVKRITEKRYKENIFRCASFERQQQLEALNRLQSLQSLHHTALSYDEVKVHKNSVIYCDIPYQNTNAYGKQNSNIFDYDKFYSWASKQTELTIISEYNMTDDFICIDEIEKSVLMNSGADQKTIERLYIPRHQKVLWESIKPVTYRQIDLFTMSDCTEGVENGKSA